MNAAKEPTNNMLNTEFFKDLVFGIIFALPFVGIKRYALRVALSIGSPLLIYAWLLWFIPHAGFHWSNEVALQNIIGALCVAHVRVVLLCVRRGC